MEEGGRSAGRVGGRSLGRPAQQLPPTWAFFYHPSNSRPFHQLTASSRDKAKYSWFTSCLKHEHTRPLQIRSLIKSSSRHQHGPVPACLYCHVCFSCNDPRVRQPSSWERWLYGQLAVQRDKRLHAFSREVCALPGRPPLDVYIPHLKLGVMVDGEQHFPKGLGHHSTSSQEQQGNDCVFNVALLAGAGRQVRGLVRLHYRDTGREWQAALERACRLLDRECGGVFIVFTKSYQPQGDIVLARTM